MDLEEFENYPLERLAFKVLIDSLRGKGLTKSYTVDDFIQALMVWIDYVLPGLGAIYGKMTPPLLAYKSSK